MPRQPPGRRIFVVGCGRSGTTLLQSLLASHPEITSFPESHFFPQLRPGRRWARKLGLISPRAPARFDAFVAAVGWPRRVRPRLPLARGYARAFVRLLDAIALKDGKANWVEKTPHHLRYIDEIESYVPDAVFIHIIRSGADVVASYYAASNEPSFKGFGGGLLIGAQFIIAKKVSIDWWILGGHFGVASLHGEMDSQIVQENQYSFYEQLEGVEIPYGTKTFEVKGSKASINFDGIPFGGIRSGLCLGFAF